MATFRAPTSSVTGLQRLVSAVIGRGRGADPLDAARVDSMAASTNQHSAAAEKIREEILAMRERERMLKDPEAQLEYAARSGNVPLPQAQKANAAFYGGDVSGVDPEHMRAINSALASVNALRLADGRTNVEQLQRGNESTLQTMLRNRIASEPDAAARRPMIEAVSGRSVDPFRLGAQGGEVINQSTGEVADVETKLGRLVRDSITAQANQRRAAAGLSDARAGVQPSIIDLNRARVLAETEGRAARKRTPAEERIDTARALAAEARAAKDESERIASLRIDTARRMRADPRVPKGARLGEWDNTEKAFVLYGKDNEILGHYD